jgi:HD-like signal output (HDOD) protein
MDLNELLALQIALPSIPKAAAVLLSELNLDNPDLKKITQVISTDPALTMRVLQLANSGFFKMSGQVSSVSEALALLKLQHVRAMAQDAATSSSIKTVPGMHLHSFWDYSLNVAKLSRSLAGVVRQNQGAAFTCGLIHAIGELAIHLGMPGQTAQLDKEVRPLGLKRAKAERLMFGFCYSQVGAGLARKWHFPQSIVDALEHQYAPFENNVYEPLAGVIHLAAWRARGKEANMSAKQLAVSFPGGVGVALGLDIDMVLQQDPIDWSAQTPGRALI